MFEEDVTQPQLRGYNMWEAISKAIYCRKVDSISLNEGILEAKGNGFTLDSSNKVQAFSLFGRCFTVFFESRVPAKDFSISGEVKSLDIITGSVKAPTEFGIVLDDTILYFCKPMIEVEHYRSVDTVYKELLKLLEDRRIRVTGDFLNFLMYK